MKIFSVILLGLLATCSAKECPPKKSTSKLFCYYSKLTDVNSCECTHVILPANSDIKSLDNLREEIQGVKFLITVNEFNQGLVNILKESKVDGLEINLKKLESKNDIADFISTVRSKLGSEFYFALSVPPKAEILAKFFDFKALSKHADAFILQTGFLGASKNVTFHPSRLSGLWDMQNTDSVVDLVVGMGAPLSKLVVTAPVQAFQFTLQDSKFTAPGSPALAVKSLTRDQLCQEMSNGKNWTLERDQDQAGPYIFSEDQWIAFEDSMSIDIKAKYSRVRGLAGMALKDLSQDGGSKCGPTILESVSAGLSKQARAPRGAVLHSLEREILETARPLDTIQVSPYRISRVIDTEGKVHAIRQDTRTEFECSRQGYFVHPRSCNRFYRCVKFDQLSDEFSVFEFDCPAGLAFDERVEVCVWPGSLPHASACSGSSEIAPVPKERFICPQEPGYYADPENCRWFFACLDHGKSPLSAYEFRCPFGLVFDQDRLVCEWSWLVPKCAAGLGLGASSEYVYGSSFALDQYDGLGSLGTVALGGLSGTINQASAKVYSNVGLVGTGYHKLGGLSINAAHSLQNAGLLKANYGSGLEGHLGNGQLYTSNSLNSNYAGFGASGSAGVLATSGHSAGYSNININSPGYYSTAQGSSQYHGQENSYVQNQYLQSGVAGNINIVGGGQSAVGKSGIHITTYDGSLDSVQGVSTVSPITATSIPTVTSVPIPAVKTATSFQSYNGGVVANFPELQQKVHVEAGNSFAQVSGGSIGYSYTKPSIVFEEKPVQKAVVQAQVGTSYVSHNQEVKNEGYVYNKPAVAFETGINSGYSVVSSTPQTIVQEVQHVQEISKPVVHSEIYKPAVSSYSETSGYVYNKPAVRLDYIETKPIQQVTVSSTVRPLIQKETISVQQPVITTYSETGGYVYDKPTLSFEESPKAVVTSYSQASTPKPFSIVSPSPQVVVSSTPIIQHKVVKPALSTYSFEKVVNSIGYDYPKPSVIFEEKPVVQKTIIQPTVTTYQKPSGYVYQKPAIRFEEKRVDYVQPVQVQHTVQQEFQGYQYHQPSIKFEEKPVVYKQPVQPIYHSYAYQQPSTGYSYKDIVQQTVLKQEAQITPAIFTSYNYAVPSSTAKPVVYQQPIQSTYGYSYPKPSVTFVEEPKPVTYIKPQPALVSTYNYVASTTSKPLTVVQQAPVSISTYQQQVNTGYDYPKPQVAFVEEPKKQIISTYNYITPSTVKPPVVNYLPVQPTTPKPAVYLPPAVKTFEQKQPTVVSYFNYETPKPTVQVYQQKSSGYVYEKPQVAFVEEPRKPIISTYNYIPPSTVKPPVVNYLPVQPTTPKLALYLPPVTPVKTIVQKQPTVVSYFNYETPKPTVQVYQQKSSGYVYEKPQVAFVEEPKKPISTYNYIPPSTVKPPVVNYLPVQPTTPKPALYLPPVTPVKTIVQKQPTVVSYFNYKTPKPTVQVYQQKSSGYIYEKPQVAFVEEPRKPAIVNSYSYVTPTTTKPAVIVQQPVVSYNIQKQPAVISSYSYEAPTVKPIIQKQTINFEVKQQQVSSGYDYPKPVVAFEEKPLQPVQEVQFVKTKAYQTGTNYEYKQKAIAQPVVVENYQVPKVQYSQSVDTSNFYYIDKAKTPVYTQEYVTTPRYEEEIYYKEIPKIKIETTPKPSYISTVANVIAVKAPQKVIYQTTPAPILKTYKTQIPIVQEVTTSRPIVRYSFSSLDENYKYIPAVSTELPVVEPTREYLPVRTRVKTTVTPKYVESYVVPEVTTVAYVPLKIKSTVPTKVYLPAVKSTVPTVKYLPVKTTTPSREYLPVKTTVPSREYLPIRASIKTTTAAYDGEEIELTRKPLKVVKVVRPKAKAIVKENDFHPLLSAKLGAQCTCVSNTVKLNRKKTQKIIVVDDDEDDDGYAVKDADEGYDDGYNADDESKPIIVENYEYEPKKLVDITPTPQIYIKSSSTTIQPERTVAYKIRKRVRVRPVSTTAVYDLPITEAKEIFIKSRVTPAIIETSSEKVSDREIVKAVRTGLKLVKEAAKEGAKEGTKEVLNSKDFDRYGPGGVRSRNERLQGTIDCQRAGLFRHPTQCNKFYACRWDCTKNKFTLHVFNCPVHLTFDNTLGACNWPSQGPACLENTLLPSE